MSTCASCGAATRPGAAFCGECGTPLPPDSAPAAERPGFITLPPGVTPVAATNTGPAPSPAARAAAAPPPPAPIVPPTMTAPPVVAPVVPPVVTVSARLPAPAAEPADVDATRMAAPRRTTAWSLVLPDGATHPIATSAVVGRAPDAAAHGAAAAISVGAEQKSVSKSHALLETTATGLRVRDLGSVNGVVVAHVDGRESEATTAIWVELADGDELELGEVVIVIRRA